MSKPFHYPEFDETGVKILSRAGDTVNNMMMDITIYRMFWLAVRNTENRTSCIRTNTF